MKVKFKPTPPSLPVEEPESATPTAQLTDIDVLQSEVLKEDAPAGEEISAEFLYDHIPERPEFDDEYEGRLTVWRAKAILNEGYPIDGHGGTEWDDFLDRRLTEVVILFEEGVRDAHELWQRAEARASAKVNDWWHPPAKGGWR